MKLLFSALARSAHLRHAWRRLSSLRCAPLALALLSGCAPLPTQHAAPTATRAYSEAIDIDGRFSAQFERNDKPESWSGSFTWKQTPQHTTVALLSPLGQTLATIAVDPFGATLSQSGKPPRSAADVDALAQETLGWPLPVSNLRDWLQAYAVTANGTRIAVTPDEVAAISTRDGWRIRYVSWQDDNDATTHVTPAPRRIDMERDTVAVGKVQMRLIITNWQTH